MTASPGARRIDGNNATLVYTEVPGAVEEIRPVPVSSIRPVELSYQTRVWLPSTAFGWIPAEIAGLLSRGGRVHSGSRARRGRFSGTGRISFAFAGTGNWPIPRWR